MIFFLFHFLSNCCFCLLIMLNFISQNGWKIWYFNLSLVFLYLYYRGTKFSKIFSIRRLASYLTCWYHEIFIIFWSSQFQLISLTFLIAQVCNTNSFLVWEIKFEIFFVGVLFLHSKNTIFISLSKIRGVMRTSSLRGYKRECPLQIILIKWWHDYTY